MGKVRKPSGLNCSKAFMQFNSIVVVLKLISCYSQVVKDFEFSSRDDELVARVNHGEICGFKSGLEILHRLKLS